MDTTIIEAQAEELPVMTDPNPDDLVDVGKYMTEKELDAVAEIAIDDYKAAVKSRRPHMVELEKNQKLYACTDQSNSGPYAAIPNIGMPLVAYASNQVASRLYDMLLPADGTWFRSKPTDADDIDRAERTTKYVALYMRRDVPEFAGDFDKTCTQTTLNGDSYIKCWRDPHEKRMRLKTIGVTDMVLPYWCNNPDPSLRGVPCYTEVQRYTGVQIKENQEDGTFYTVKLEEVSGSTDVDDDATLRKTVDSVAGQAPQDEGTEDYKLRPVLEQHRWLVLKKNPKHKRMDGRLHSVTATIDYKSRKVLRLALREEDDPRDRRRYDREMKAHAEEVAKFQQMLVPSMPEPPEPCRQREMCLYTNFGGWPSEGAYHLGFGAFIGPLNRAGNEFLRQFAIALAMNNSPPAFISRQHQMTRGDISTAPGKVNEVNIPPGQIKDAIVWMQTPMPNSGMASLVDKVEIWANRMTASGEILSGEPTGANETAKGMTIRVEQAMKSITVQARRMTQAMQHLADKIWRYFAVFVEEEEYIKVSNEDGTFEEIRISRDDFRADSDLVPVADPRVGSRVQEAEEAMQLYAMCFGGANQPPNPLLMNDPEVLYAVTQRVLKAMHEPEIARLVKPPPPAPPEEPPPTPMSQEEEDEGFLMGKPHPVMPDDDDETHMMRTEFFKQDPKGYKILPPDMKKLYDDHERTHAAQRMRKGRENGFKPLLGDVQGGSFPMES